MRRKVVDVLKQIWCSWVEEAMGLWGRRGQRGTDTNDRQRTDKVEENRPLEEVFSQRGTDLLYGLVLV